MSKLDDFLKKNGIDTRRILVASKKLENLRPEDRKVKLAKYRVREGKANDAEKELGQNKPRSGRSVSEPTLARALRGAAIPPKAQERITRAVNHVLEQKKKDKVGRADLF